MAATIFKRVGLNPGRAREVAERRLQDADRLARSGLAKHANGAMYLAGYVVECLLKAALLEKRTDLQRTDSTGLKPDDMYVWGLIHRRHDLDLLLAELPAVQDRVANASPDGAASLLQDLKRICATWTIFARYSPYHAKMDEAVEFVQRVRDLKPWLR